jgi:dihydrofolate reductase
MKKVILGVALSLDGFIEGPTGEYDWCPPPSDEEMGTFMNSVDSIFFGRKSFELMGPTAFPDKKCYVFSNSLKTIKGKNVELVSGDVISKVKAIKNGTGKNIWLFGGASLTTTFINEGLVDELWLGVVPIVLGAGKPLFENIQQRTYFELIDSVTKNGYLSVRYALKT